MTRDPQAKIRVEHLSCFYGDFRALDDLSLEIRPREVFGLMGPSKSGKSTFLRVLNRMCDLIDGRPADGRAPGWTTKTSWPRTTTWCDCAAGWAWC